MIQAKNLGMSFGTQNLFENVTFQLGSKERIGLVGRNGTGKSTLFKIVLGEITATSGEITRPKDYTIGSLEQHIHFTKPTVLEECEQVLRLALKEGEELFSTHEAEKILFGLGFKDEDLQKDPKSFSGGYQIRINLTKALLKKPNLLLLDEPTNYLDIVSIRWLKNFLRNFDGEILLITHDRDFMDEVVTHTMGIHRHALKKIKGDTVKYYEQILLDEELYEKARESFERKKKEMQSFIDRFKAKASKAAQAQSRVKALEKMGNMNKLSNVEDLGFKFRYADIPAKTLFEVKHLAFGYNESDKLFHGLSFAVNKNDRIGIIGKNGKGKSTLLNNISGDLSPLEGKISFHPSVKVGHFGQTNIQRMSLEATIIEEIQSENGDLSIAQVRNIAGTMMFDGDLAKKKIKVLSGGERARVLLGKILAKPANLLLLDEPTNHLDLESIESLTEEIANFEGAVVLVTHSEIMLRNLCNKLVIFHQGNAEYFEGTYDDFLEKIGWEEEKQVSQVVAGKLSEKELKQRRIELVQERAKRLRPHQDLIEQLEKDIEEKETFSKRLMEALNSSEVLSDNSKLQDYTHALGKLNQQIDDLFEKLSLEEEKVSSIQSEYSKLLE